jgi:hypothetical protein
MMQDVPVVVVHDGIGSTKVDLPDGVEAGYIRMEEMEPAQTESKSGGGRPEKERTLPRSKVERRGPNATA